LQKAEDDAKIVAQHRDSIVGKVVVAHALANPDYRHQLTTLLRAEVKNKTDIAVIAELLA